MVSSRGNDNSSASLCSARETLLSDGCSSSCRKKLLPLAGRRAECPSTLKAGYRRCCIHRVPRWSGESHVVRPAPHSAKRARAIGQLSIGACAWFRVEGGLL